MSGSTAVARQTTASFRHRSGRRLPPQGQAHAWLAGMAASALIVLVLCTGSVDAIRTSPHDVLALVALRQEVVGRNGAWRGAMDKWPLDTCNREGVCEIDPCASLGNNHMHEGMPWEGLDCRYQDNLKDDVPRVITNIHLPKRGLDGPPPTAISLFRNLTEIDMDTNQLTGTLPREWACLPDLVEIDMSKNLFTGQLPTEWGILDKLIEMEVDGNRGLAGCLPAGTPPPQRLCGIRRSIPCPEWTLDVMVGADLTNTGISRSRCRETVPLASLKAGLKCPTLREYEPVIKAYFDSRDAKLARAAQVKSAQGAATASAAAAGQVFQPATVPAPMPIPATALLSVTPPTPVAMHVATPKPTPKPLKQPINVPVLVITTVSSMDGQP